MPAAPPPVETTLISANDLPGHAQRVGGRGADDDGGAVLIVVKNGDVHPRAADILDDEAVGRLDVLEVDGPEGRLERADDLGQTLGIGFVQLDIEAVDIGEFLEQDRLALHHRLGGEPADIAQPQHRRSVRHDANKVAAGGVVSGGFGIGLDLDTGLGDTGAVGKAEVAPIGQRLGGPNLELTRPRQSVVIEGGPFVGLRRAGSSLVGHDLLHICLTLNYHRSDVVVHRHGPCIPPQARPHSARHDWRAGMTLVDEARRVRGNAYAPYSNFKVGAAIRASTGQVYTGVNVENVAYPEGTCAEAGAVAAMVAAGETQIAEIAVIADSPMPVSPCGGCRQKLAEFGRGDVPVTLATTDGAVQHTTLAELLPGAFTRDYMERS